MSSIAVSVLFMALIVLMGGNAGRMVALWSASGMDVSLYLELDAGEEQVVELKDRLAAYPEVARVNYLSREEAWQFLADNLGDSAELLSGLDSSVLPASLELSLALDADPGSLPARFEEWANLEGVDDLQYNRYELSRRSSALPLVAWLTLGLCAVAGLASLIIVGAGYQLAAYSRREELDVMRLLGAVGNLYWGPILLAGLIEGTAAAGIALGVTLMGYGALSSVVLRQLPLLGEAVAFLSPTEIVRLLGWGAFLGGFGSLIGMWRISKWR